MRSSHPWLNLYWILSGFWQKFGSIITMRCHWIPILSAHVNSFDRWLVCAWPDESVCGGRWGWRQVWGRRHRGQKFIHAECSPHLLIISWKASLASHCYLTCLKIRFSFWCRICWDVQLLLQPLPCWSVGGTVISDYNVEGLAVFTKGLKDNNYI